MRKQSYREKLNLKRAAFAALGLVSERYAEISAIEFEMTYYRRGFNQVLMKRTLSLTPSDYAGFHMKCMHEGCVNGGYDLAPVTAAMVKTRRKKTSGKFFYHGTNDSVGHASIAYVVKIRYCKA
ncbi:MAG TPA: hypothetical protein VK654_00680 [Nitrospirota bacterium]|nr:hypothetical protein [Nitrospirota bacterium]